MKFVFGPVPSRRLGRSLGIDPIPLKTCNWNCVYCQLGRSRPLANERRVYFPPEDILAEARLALNPQTEGKIDWVTFVGSGETCLYLELGRLICQVKTLTSLPVAVITNGSLLYLPEVREELSVANAVMPSLDAGTPELYRRVNRSWPQITFDRLLEGLISFRQGYTGQLWVEVMLVDGLNDTDESLRKIAEKLEEIQPDQIHLLMPTRPPAEPWVQPSQTEGVQRAMDILGAVAPCMVPDSLPGVLTTSVVNMDNLELAILGIVTRHPMREKELCNELNEWSVGEVHHTLEQLLAQGKVQAINRYGDRFWGSSGSFFGR